jgi:hypothetical protein
MARWEGNIIMDLEESVWIGFNWLNIQVSCLDVLKITMGTMRRALQ